MVGGSEGSSGDDFNRQNQSASSTVAWRPSNVSNENNRSCDDEIEHSPPRRSIQHLNSSEKKQTSI